ncbi:MAG: hypothetical protein AB7O65_11940 [Candidatus Korobacteraceae bacterium]
MSQCVDRVVGGILASWRYDISGIVPEMRSDYELHFAECEHCRSRRRLHRAIDLSLMVLTACSAALCLLAFGAVYHFQPRHSLLLEVIALGGFALSALLWLIVAVATPAPLAMADAARLGARAVHDHLPQEIRQRIPEELRLKISGQS